MRVIEHLRNEGEPAHRRLDSTEFALALIEGRVDRQRYVDYLRATAIIVDTLRTQTQSQGTASQRTAFRRVAEWSERLAADLAHLGPGNPSANASAHAAALAFADRIHCRIADGSAFLLGVAYVLTGSHRGHRSVVAKVKTALALVDDAGTRYLSTTRGEGEAPWREFLAFLERELDSPAALHAASDGMRATFAAFESILTALHEDAARTLHVSVINPEAGNHPISQDPEILALAITAAERAVAQFPYLDFRYGLRGRRFARSDSAWLVTLCDFEAKAAERQIDWLVGVLAARGIPSLVLESHLRQLADIMPRARGDEAGARLQKLARRVARHRDDGLFARGDRSSVKVPEFGEQATTLLTCAAADQHAGIAACADNIRTWSRAEARLSDDSKRAITDVLDRAAQLLAS